jgi:hypothetical protein
MQTPRMSSSLHNRFLRSAAAPRHAGGGPGGAGDPPRFGRLELKWQLPTPRAAAGLVHYATSIGQAPEFRFFVKALTNPK